MLFELLVKLGEVLVALLSLNADGIFYFGPALVNLLESVFRDIFLLLKGLHC